MKQPASHKDIDFGQTLYVAEKVINEPGHYNLKIKKVNMMDASGWFDNDHEFYQWDETFYTAADMLEYLKQQFKVK